MTHNEFQALTHVAVTMDEFWAIVRVYNASPLSKKEFCAMWCKMNPDRVRAAKQAEAEADRHNADFGTLLRVVDKLARFRASSQKQGDYGILWLTDITDVITPRDGAALHRLGIETHDVCNEPRKCAYIELAINEYLQKIK